jgi:hypothetical protein
MAWRRTPRRRLPAIRFAGVTVEVRRPGYVAITPEYLKAGGDGRNRGLVAPPGSGMAAAQAVFERSLDGEG